MTNEKMTVHHALAELKTMDDRIMKAIRECKYVAAVKHSAEKINGMTIDEYKNTLKSGYQKVVDLINRRNAMKRAVVLSNAKTMVTINGVEYSVAEAIDMKTHGMDHKADLLRIMAYCNSDAMNEMKRNDDEALEKRAEQYILSLIAAQPKDGKSSVDSDEMQNLRKSYIANNRYDLIDPLNVVKVMAELDEEINKFNAEVDATLSVSNALTTIEFEY